MVSVLYNNHIVMKPVFLIGYMGCGKTTLGEPLAQVMGLPVVDLDAYIENKHSMSAKEIFAKLGEPHFRHLEHEALTEVAAGGGDVIVACGGGTPLQPENMELMNSVGITVWLTTSVDRIVSRLVLPEQRIKRPLLNEMSDEEIRQQVINGLKARRKYYRKAQLQFDSTYLESVAEVEDSARRLAQILKDYAHGK